MASMGVVATSTADSISTRVLLPNFSSNAAVDFRVGVFFLSAECFSKCSLFLSLSLSLDENTPGR